MSRRNFLSDEVVLVKKIIFFDVIPHMICSLEKRLTQALSFVLFTKAKRKAEKAEKWAFKNILSSHAYIFSSSDTAAWKKHRLWYWIEGHNFGMSYLELPGLCRPAAIHEIATQKTYKTGLKMFKNDSKIGHNWDFKNGIKQGYING